MKTDYSAYDKVYQRLRETGSEWNTPEQLAETTALLARFFNADGVPRSGRALELGCGSGQLSLWLAERGFEVSGIDISENAIEWARENFAARGLHSDFHVGSVLDLSAFQEDCFDVVLDGHCLHCIIGPDRERFFSKAHRVLKPNGILHLATMCGKVRDPKISAMFDEESKCLVRDGIAFRQIKEAPDILREVEAAGFHILQWEIDPAVDIEDQDDLLVNATKSSR